MAHPHSTQRFMLETLNQEKTSLPWCHTFQLFIVLISPFTIQYIQYFRYSVATKTLIPSFGINLENR
jgi:hypothetical protein